MDESDETSFEERQAAMSIRQKPNHKHLTMSQRIIIEKGLENNESFSLIAQKTGKDSSTISKEVRKRLVYHVKKDCGRDIPCAKRTQCRIRILCGDRDCVRLCKMCVRPKIQCTNICPQYEEKICNRLERAPYVCNGCAKKANCLLRRSYYSAKQAQDGYLELLVSSREGINQSPVDIAMIDALISPLLKKGQSLAHIYAHHGSEIPFCRKTLYNYIDKSVFTARNIDLRRRVRYKVRKRPTRVSVTARAFRVGRMYEDFCKLMKEHPDTPVVEMDTVVGGTGKGSKVFLTMFFRNCSLMLIFLLEEKTWAHVTKVFNWMSEGMGTEAFRELFPVILTDNGTEFQKPIFLERDAKGNERTKIYYCNPNSSWQKGMIEKNHTYIRLVVPKGESLEQLTQEDATMLMNHINSEARDKLNGCTPFNLSLLLLNNQLHDLLHLEEIAPDDVSLRPRLLK